MLILYIVHCKFMLINPLPVLPLILSILFQYGNATIHRSAIILKLLTPLMKRITLIILNISDILGSK